MNAISAFSAAPASNAMLNTTDTNSTHTIERGESLSQIASAHSVSVDALIAANPQIKNPDIIYPDDVLNIPTNAANTQLANVSSTASNQRLNIVSTTATTTPEKSQDIQTLQVSENGKKLVRDAEGFFSQPYNDPAGHATIGYGHLLHRGNVTAADRTQWGTLSEPAGRQLLDKDINEVAAQVKSLVKVRYGLRHRIKLI